MKYKLITIIKSHWPKILSVSFFVLLLGAYVNIFAVFTPGQTLNPNCAPGEEGCYIEFNSGNTSPWLTSSSGIYHNGNVNVGSETAQVNTLISGGVSLSNTVIDTFNEPYYSTDIIPAITTDNYGNPVIAYYSSEVYESTATFNFIPTAYASGPSYLILIHCQDSSCNSYEEISVTASYDFDVDPLYKPSIKVDGENRVHVAFTIRGEGLVLAHTVCDNGFCENYEFISSIILNSDYGLGGFSLSLDDDDNPYIIYTSQNYVSGNYEVSLARYYTGTDAEVPCNPYKPNWSCQTVLSDENADYYLGGDLGQISDLIQINEEGNPVFIATYEDYDSSDRFITYNECSSIDCSNITTNIIDSIGDNGEIFSFELNNEGLPYIAYIVSPIEVLSPPGDYNPLGFNSLNLFGLIKTANASTSNAYNIFISYLNESNGSGCSETSDWTCRQITGIYDEDDLYDYNSLDMKIGEDNFPQISATKNTFNEFEDFFSSLDYIKCLDEECLDVSVSTIVLQEEAVSSPYLLIYSQMSISESGDTYLSYINHDNDTLNLSKINQALDPVSFNTINSLYSGGDLGISGNLFVDGSIVTPSGLYLNDGIPDITSNALYNDGGDLYWGDNAVILEGDTVANATNASYAEEAGYASTASNLSSTLYPSRGGTGRTYLTSGYLLSGNGTSAVNLIAPSTSGNVLTSNGSSWVSSAPVGSSLTSDSNHNTLGGEGAGQKILDNPLSGSQYNTFIGYQTGMYGSNSAIGGDSNTAIGTQSFYLNTTGKVNTANGFRSLNQNTTGSYNTANGSQSLYYNTTGYNNTALGYNSGAYYGPGGSTLNQTSNNSLYLGYDTRASANGNTNEIVVGYGTIGAGSNTAVIGNSSTIGVYFGSSNPRARLYSRGLTLSAGTATAGTAPLKFTAGTNLTTTEAGAIEYDGSHLYFTATNGGTRYQLDQQSGGSGGLSSDADFNTKGGTSAGLNLVAGAQYNTFLGYQSGMSGSSGSNRDYADFNTAVGYQSLYSNTAGSGNTANGYQSLYSNTGGSYNTANGFQSLYSNTTGSFNTANSAESLFYNTTGSFNTANSYFSLFYNTTGYHNTANGYSSLHSNTTGSQNTANGSGTLSSNTTGSYNTANGYYSLHYNTTGYSNTANGYYSLYNSGKTLTAGSLISGVTYTIISTGNTDFTVCGAVDSNPGTIFTHNGTPCTGTGTASSNSNNNVAEGYQSGMYISGGSTALTASLNSLFLGADTKALQDGSNNEIVIGYNATGHGSNTAQWGSTAITGHYFSGNVQYSSYGAGTLTTDASGNITASSDERLKNIIGYYDNKIDNNTDNTDDTNTDNITEIQKSALERIMEINPIIYKWNEKSGLETEHTYVGFSAQNLQLAIPEAVGLDKRVDPETGENYLTISDRPILATVVNAIKEMDLKIKDLEDLELENSSSLSDIINLFFNDVVEKVENGIAYLTNLVVDTIEIGSSDKPTGIILYSKSGDKYCLFVNEEGNSVTETMQEGDECPKIEKIEAPSDIDKDGVVDEIDNCPSAPNELQEDEDSNGVGDACEKKIDPSNPPADPKEPEPGTI